MDFWFYGFLDKPKSDSSDTSDDVHLQVVSRKIYRKMRGVLKKTRAVNGVSVLWFFFFLDHNDTLKYAQSRQGDPANGGFDWSAHGMPSL